MSPVRTVTLLVAHGSRRPDAAAVHEDLCAAVTAALAAGGGPHAEVRPAHLAMSEPSLPAAIDAAAADGAEVIRVVPYFLLPGNHVLVDIPAHVEQARAKHPGLSIKITQHLGADPRLVAVLAELAAG